ncbi:hypothetical protein PMAYCL1PPCAC_09389, partial [Pristionchus mayeri]
LEHFEHELFFVTRHGGTSRLLPRGLISFCTHPCTMDTLERPGSIGVLDWCPLFPVISRSYEFECIEMRCADPICIDWRIHDQYRLQIETNMNNLGRGSILQVHVLVCDITMEVSAVVGLDGALSQDLILPSCLCNPNYPHHGERKE